MGAFIIMALWLCPAALIIGAAEDSGVKASDVGCVAFVPILNIFVALAIFFNGGRL